MSKHDDILTFSDDDMYNLDMHLADFICANLKKFRRMAVDKKQGVPSDFLCDDQGHLKNFHSDQELDEGFQKYLDVLDKIIYAFDASEEPDIGDYDFDFEPVPLEGEGESTRYSLELVRNNEKAYERYQEDMNDWQEKCEEGRHLLAQHFRCLWL